MSRDLAERCIRLASRAPSAHNTQPWAPRIVGDGDALRVELGVHPSRTLPAGDPSNRDLLLALGCWVEAFAIGAAAEGVGVVVEAQLAIGLLHELPIDGPAAPDRPLLTLRFEGVAAPGDDTPSDVRERAVHRGRLEPIPGVMADVPLPSWLRLREVAGRDLAQLASLGTAATFAREATARELLSWLRLSPSHPRYRLDGLTDRTLLLPAAVARVGALLTRKRRMRDGAVATAALIARVAEGLQRGAADEMRAPASGRRRHFALVADARAAGQHGVRSATEQIGGRLGLPEVLVVEAGRTLMRLWLATHRAGGAVSPHSEIIDSPAADGILRRRLGLGRSAVVLAVFTAGRPTGPIARSARLTDR